MQNSFKSTGLGVALLLFASSAAIADPCTASLPKAGTVFEGTVRYIVDGDGLCVGQTADPKSWIEVRLADFYAPELREAGGAKAKATLERIVMGRQVSCRARNRSYDRIVAQCSVGGRDLGELMKENGVSEGGRAFRNR